MKPIVRLLVPSAVLLTACSMTLPVRGSLQTTGESFTGTATGYLDGSGKMKLTSDRGAACQGNFVYKTSREGEGVLRCEDGRTGPFTFASTGKRGTGQGELSGQKFIFTFGKQ